MTCVKVSVGGLVRLLTSDLPLTSVIVRGLPTCSIGAAVVVPVAFLLAGMMVFVEVIATDSVGFKPPMLVREGAMEEDLFM